MTTQFRVRNFFRTTLVSAGEKQMLNSNIGSEQSRLIGGIIPVFSCYELTLLAWNIQPRERFTPQSEFN